MRHSVSAPSGVKKGAAAARGRLAGMSFATWAAKRRRQRTADACWEEFFDEEQGVTYFYNNVTGESTWHDPRSTAAAGAGAGAAAGDGAGAGAYYDAAGYTELGFPPKPNLLVLARAATKWKRHKQEEMRREIQWVQGELLAFEKQKQAELRAEIQRLSEELDDNKDERDAELKGMLNAFSNITEKDVVNEEQARKGETQRQIDELWDEHKDSLEGQRGAHLLERERQRAKLQERLEARNKKKFLQKLKQIDAQLAERRKEADSKIREIESKFAGYIALRTNAMDKLRRIAHSVQKKKLAARGRTSHAGHEEATSATPAGYCPWVELVDESTQHKYWYNHDTGAAQWVCPEELAAEEDDPFWEDEPEAALEAVEEAAQLAEQWVTQDELAHAQAQTAELERVAAEMRAQASKSTEMSAGELFDMLEGFMELEDDEDVVADKAERVYQDMVAERELLESRLNEEKERQKTRLQERLKQRQKAALKKREARAKKAIADKHKSADVKKRLLHGKAAALKRKGAAGLKVVTLNRFALNLRRRARRAVTATGGKRPK